MRDRSPRCRPRLKAPAFVAAALAIAAAGAPGASLAQPGSASRPIVLRLAPGGTSATVRGVLRQGVDCCAYAFRARAGQTLRWRESGATARVLLKYPDGHIDGPGLPAAIPLPSDGVYVLTVSPNLMAEGAFGPFSLTLTFPPAR